MVDAATGAFANDLLNLLAVDGPINQRKSERDAPTLAATQRGLPLLLRRTADRGEGKVRSLGHQRTGRGAEADPGDVSLLADADRHESLSCPRSYRSCGDAGPPGCTVGIGRSTRFSGKWQATR